MVGGKKAKRGGTAKQRQAMNASPPVQRNTAFIETASASEGVFPREVRNQIYRYLLLGRNVKEQRNSELWNDKGPAYHYRFKVNVLRANKAVYAEARKVLYGENTFVVLSTKEHEICYRFKLHAIPVVSEDFSAVDSFSEHSLYVRLEGPHRASPAGPECNCEYCGAPPPEKRRLLLSDDLPAFIRICRILNHMDPNPTFKLIDAPRDGTFSYRRLCEKRKPSTTMIRFQNNTYGSTTPSFVEDSLTQFRKVAGDRQVEIIAPSHPWLATECKESMMPKVVWGYAIAWDLVEVARELKVAADEMIKSCSSERTWADKLAMKLYEGILILLGNSMIFRRLGAEGLALTYKDKYCKSDTDTCFCLDWIESWTLLNLDLAVASIVLNLFSGTDETASSHMLDAWKFMLKSSRVPDETSARAHHVMAFVQAKVGNCRGALESLKKAETHREMAGLEPDAGLKQDIAKQVKHMKVCKPNHRDKDDRICLCCSSFAGQACEAKDSVFDGAKPAGIFAWQDFDHQLTEDNLKAMALTRKDVPPRVHAEADAPLDPSEQLEAMDLST